MSQENVDIIRRSMEYFKRTDEWPWRVIDPEIEIHDHDVPDGGVFHGHPGWLKWVDTFDSAWEHVSMEPEEYIDAGGDKAVLLHRLAARGRGGISLERQDGIVYTRRDRMIVRMDYYGSQAEALEAVGLRVGAEAPRRAPR
jgi:ketosteroid isomerase-like protein